MEEGATGLYEPGDHKGCNEIVPPSNVRNYTHKVLPTWLPEHELNKDCTSGQAEVDREKPWGLNPTQRSICNWVKLGANGSSSLLGEKQTNGCTVPLNRLYLGKNMCMHICVCNNSQRKKRPWIRRTVGKGLETRKGREKCNYHLKKKILTTQL